MSDTLLEAIQTHDVDRIAQLLAAGADPNEDGKSRYDNYGNGRDFPLQAAIGELEAFGEDHPAGPIESVILLLRHGAKVNCANPSRDGDPLMIAAFMNHVEAVRLLLSHGADPNVRDDEGNSPLRFCVEKSYIDMAQLLLRCGATKTIDQAGGGGSDMTVLGVAAYWLDVEMVKLLLAHGADPNVLDNDRMTVFDHLRNKERYADPPLDPASQERLQEIRRLLGEPSANV